MANEKKVKTETTKNTDLENSDMKELLAQMKSLQKELNKLKAEKTQPVQTSAPTNTDREVSFVSLTPGMLNLSTEGNGQGQVYSFDHFGQIHFIPYSEAKMILKNQPHFARAGYFYIDDEELIKNSQLTVAYKTIIDQATFEELFTTSPSAFSKIFKGIPEAQRESFADMLAKKLYDGEKIDMNIVQEVNTITRRNISTEAIGDKEIFGDGSTK